VNNAGQATVEGQPKLRSSASLFNLSHQFYMASFCWLTISTAARGISRHTLRFGLTLLGLAIGVAAVITVISLSTGARIAVQEHVATEGVNVIYAFAKARLLQGVRGMPSAVTRLTLDDVFEIQSFVPSIREVCWWRRQPSTIIRLNRNVATGVYGVSPGCLSVKNWLPREGEMITEDHNKWGLHVALLGQTVVDTLFDPEENPIGTPIRINNVIFKVIGVLNAKGSAPSGYDQDDLILIPFTTAQRVYGAQAFNQVQLVAVSTYRKEDLEQAAEQMRAILRYRHRLDDSEPDDFVIRTQLEIERLFDGAGQILGTLLVWLAAGSLLVAMAGVINVALVSVVERTKEIGIRMAVGATRAHIFLQFLCESTIVGVFGGVAGIALGILASFLIESYFGWPVTLSLAPMLEVMLGLILVGTCSGLYPAWRAASVNPIESIRHE
jgi:putative ABC transport system permease protein